MTVSDVYEDPRNPGLPYVVTIRYGATESLIENHRFPIRSMAEEAAAMIRAHGLDTSPWPTHVRPGAKVGPRRCCHHRAAALTDCRAPGGKARSIHWERRSRPAWNALARLRAGRPQMGFPGFCIR